MFHHILVPLDGSPRAEQALPVALRLASASGATLTLLRVITPLLEFDLNPVKLSRHINLPLDADIARANEYLTQVISTRDLAGIDVQTEVLTGAAAQSIVLCAQLQYVDLIVMCSHGLTGFKRWRLGSVAQHVARHSSAPALVLHEGGPILTARAEDAPRPLCVLVALDGSPLAEAVLLPAAQICTALAAPGRGALHLVQVLRLLPVREDEDEGGIARMNEPVISDARAYLHAVAPHLREGEAARFDLTVTSSIVVHTDIADTLIRVAEHGEFVEDIAGFDGCDVIAMATHGRGGPQRWLMGSITERVLGATRLPLLIVCSHQPYAEETSATQLAKE